jgi:galactokinase
LRYATIEQFEAHERELPGEVAKRCRFILEENQRVLRLVDAIAGDDRKTIGMLCDASFRGACDLYEIAVPAMHAMFDAMRLAPGAVGARQAGAGFGGCMVAFVEKAKISEFVESVQTGYLRAIGVPAEILPVEAVGGAGLMNVAAETFHMHSTRIPSTLNAGGRPSQS